MPHFRTNVYFVDMQNNVTFQCIGSLLQHCCQHNCWFVLKNANLCGNKKKKKNKNKIKKTITFTVTSRERILRNKVSKVNAKHIL